MESDIDSDATPEIFLSFFWHSGKIGAAYYDSDSHQIFILADIPESAPDFWICKQVIFQVNPTVIITSAKQDDRLIQTLQSECGINVSPHQPPAISGIKRKFCLLPSFDFGVESSKRKITGINLPSFAKLITPADKAIHLSSIINFNFLAMVRSFGGLLNFLHKNRIGIELEDENVTVPIISINNFNLSNLVALDENTLGALQIFYKENHPSVYKSTSSGKEGLSLFGILNRCKSTIGTQKLRSLMTRPTSDEKLINDRHEAISFFLQVQNSEVVASMQSSLKHIKNVASILGRMASGQASTRDWHSLYNSLYNALLIGDLVKTQNKNIDIFKRVTVAYVEEIISVADVINKIVDFEESAAKNQFVVNWGIDDELDKKRQNYNSLPALMSKLARDELQDLNETIEMCTVVYLPQLGYLLEIPMTDQMQAMGNFNLPNLEFVFSSNKLVYYRSERTLELHRNLGDAQHEITDHEMKIMISLQSVILEHAVKLIDFIDCIAELDCLISLAFAAKENNYTQPKVLKDYNNILIKGGRHPLQELCVSVFVPNDTRSIIGNKIQLLTGPNASGKSIYLKQVALIVYMAHIGSFVPAERAKIGIISKIFTRVRTLESISTGLSTFMIDLIQMSHAMKYSDEKSLVIIDEFGKGTDTVDCKALVAANLQYWLRMEQQCPHVFIATNFLSVLNLIPETQEITLLTMDVLQEDGDMVYLYQLVPGKVECSFALQVAKNAGVSEKVLRRSIEVIETICNQQVIQRQRDDSENKSATCLAIVSEFMKLDLDNGDEVKNLMRKMATVTL